MYDDILNQFDKPALKELTFYRALWYCLKWLFELIQYNIIISKFIWRSKFNMAGMNIMLGLNVMC